MPARRASMNPPHPMRLHRIALNFSQEELALRAGVSRSVVMLVECNGHTPSYEGCVRLAAALGVTAEALWGEAGMIHVIGPHEPLPGLPSNGQPTADAPATTDTTAGG